MADSGLIDDEDLKLIQFADTATEAWDLIQSQSQTPRHRQYGPYANIYLNNNISSV
ncbi:hypothetical protein SynROS8604_01988 [Synechococcus sp. ROS8604]|nr:hypothetical protein SynROS8604_01988 [Synechococcus sp. ROS8604]